MSLALAGGFFTTEPPGKTNSQVSKIKETEEQETGGTSRRQQNGRLKPNTSIIILSVHGLYHQLKDRD